MAKVLAVVLLVGGCASMPPVVVCPPVATYSLMEQTQASVELEALPTDSVLARMIVDYGGLRQQLRAACNP